MCRFFVEIVVILQVGLVALQFLLGVIWDATCSNETKFLMSLEENRDLVLKQAISTISAKFGSGDVSSSPNKKSTQGSDFWESQKASEKDLDSTMDNYVSDVVTGGGTGVMAGSVTAKGEVAKLSPAAAAAAAASKPTKLPRPEAVHKLFKDYDFDESGEIDLEELRDMISEVSGGGCWLLLMVVDGCCLFSSLRSLRSLSVLSLSLLSFSPLF